MKTFYGTDAPDTLKGSAGADDLYGYAENDELFGLAGNDRLYGGTGNDRLSGGKGADQIFGGLGTDILDYQNAESGVGVHIDLLLGTAFGGDAEGDTFSSIEGVHGSQFADTLLGTEGADIIWAGYGDDVIEGRGGDDFISSGSLYFPLPAPVSFNKQISGGSGNDEIWADQYTSFVSGGTGNDVIHSGKVIRGGAGHDILYADSADTQIFGGVGNDLIFDSYGTDVIDAGGGDDEVIQDGLHQFGSDSDRILLGAGADIAHVQMNDAATYATILVDGGVGFDSLILNDGYYSALGGQKMLDFRVLESGAWLRLGNIKIHDFEEVYLLDTRRIQTVLFGDHDDVFVGSGYFNTVYGNGGGDYLDGGEGGDKLYGGRGDDRIVADGGTSDRFHRAFGGSGDDFIFGYFGSADYNSRAVLKGGSGSDGFSFVDADHMRSAERDVVLDFEATEDWIGLSFASYFPLNPPGIGIDAATTHKVALEKTLTRDDAAFLTFTCESQDVFGAFHSHTVRYNRGNGHLSIITDAGEAETIAIVRGAPVLSADHFFGLSAFGDLI